MNELRTKRSRSRERGGQVITTQQRRINRNNRIRGFN